MTALPKVGFDRAALARQLLALKRDSGSTYRANGQHFYAPRTLDELLALRAAHPKATLLAGSTDVGLWVTKQMRDLGDIIYLGQVGALKTMAEVVGDDGAGMLEIGAGVSLDEAYLALCRHYPQQLSEMRQRFASLPIRNAGTLGGNVANGSPIGDSMPWMIALGSEVVLRSSAGRRVLALEAFYLDYQKKDMRPDELVEAVRVPLPRAGVQFRTYKLAKRFDQDISAVCAAFAFRLDGALIRDARIAFGGMAATPKRAARAEAVLNGKPWSEDNLRLAMDLLAQDYAPLSDMRASSEYRMKTAQNLLRRFWFETRAEAPLAADAVNAFACNAEPV
jgi:xanthine dehydrogenase small subunit